MQNLRVMEVHGVRVLTTRQIASMYGTEPEIINNNFLRNKGKYVPEKHYISVFGEEMRSLRTSHQFDGELKRVSRAYFWTEKGALLHAKSLNTDKAWEVYDYLVDFYFRAKEKPVEEKPVKQIPVARPKANVRLVVDIPENVKAQQIIKEIKQCLGAIEILIGESNRYLELKEFKDSRSSACDAFVALVSRMRDYQALEPKLIEKVY